MTQLQSQQSQPHLPKTQQPANAFAATILGARTVALALLVDRALSA
ncbi:hypothetical protein [Paraburkholderia flava]|nr:hypothetical protein [Paraburkholderia flava]